MYVARVHYPPWKESFLLYISYHSPKYLSNSKSVNFYVSGHDYHIPLFVRKSKKPVCVSGTWSAQVASRLLTEIDLIFSSIFVMIDFDLTRSN